MSATTFTNKLLILAHVIFVQNFFLKTMKLVEKLEFYYLKLVLVAMRILDKWFLEDASVRTKLTMELTLPLAWKDLDYDEFQLAVSQMATDWLEQRICELENDFTKVIYDPDTVFQHQDVRNILLGSCKYGGARILQNIVRLLYKRKPVELRMVIQLDRKHFQIFQAILAHCRKHRESEKLREIVDEMNRVEAEKASAYIAAKSSDDDVPY
ncbi:hypothetical protein DDL59_01790 [Neisseria gonorrhoeae]|nr:hypothetical protein A9Y61_04340 [Neisseria gonorrhoeae]EEZ50495.1 predicted protein [Neisseria gonorrhoeae PID18]EEZ54504.1 predicted protein [Neisseria gonorrhoeae PID332]EFE04620.1 predicted protein [Neisseria gonorrhoeae DGI2]KLS41466.1 hypothetical protein M720_11185 [Neisseria gonorrhoeae SK39420]KLS78319.1 hypothetical protein M771_09185 [Neisseria gonorrhoeae MU_NG1]KLS91098.1 hypothetical protein M775_10590 [Neisseria gonorrhoeae MU_NG6]KLT07937.1 hypothetical protein M791_10885 